MLCTTRTGQLVSRTTVLETLFCTVYCSRPPATDNHEPYIRLSGELDDLVGRIIPRHHVRLRDHPSVATRILVGNMLICSTLSFLLRHARYLP